MTPTVPTQRDPSSALVIRDTQEMEWFAKVPIKSIVSSSRKTCFLLVVVSIKAVEADQWGIGLSDLQFFKICYKWSLFTSLIFRSHVTSFFFFFFFLGGGAVRASHLGEMWERAASDKQCLQLPPFFLYLISAIFRRTARYFAYFLWASALGDEPKEWI